MRASLLPLQCSQHLKRQCVEHAWDGTSLRALEKPTFLENYFLTGSNACRADALHVLNMVMAAAPQHVTGTYLLPALQHYAHLLAPSQRVRSVKAGSMKNLLEVQDPEVYCAA